MKQLLKKIVLLGVVTSFSNLAQADFGTRGGGEAVVCKVNGKEMVELFDFYEVPLRYKFRLDLGSRHKGPYEKVNDKIQEIAQVDLKYAQNLEKELAVFKESHNKIPKNQLKRIFDSGSPVKVSENCEKRQFAVNRRNPSESEYKYLIDVALWNKASNSVRAGLIMHEIIYALHWQAMGGRDDVPNSEKVRYYNAFVHSRGFDEISEAKYQKEFPDKGRVKRALGESIDSIKLAGIHLHNLTSYGPSELKGVVVADQEFEYQGQTLEIARGAEVTVDQRDLGKIISVSRLKTPFEYNFNDQVLNARSFRWRDARNGRQIFEASLEKQEIRFGERVFEADWFKHSIEDGEGYNNIRSAISCISCDYGVALKIDNIDFVLHPRTRLYFYENGNIHSGEFWVLKRMRVRYIWGKWKLRIKTNETTLYYFEEDEALKGAHSYFRNEPKPSEIRDVKK